MFQPDTVREFLITRVDNRSGEVQLSIKRLETALLWQRLRQLRDYKVYYPAHVVSANQSGVLAEVHGQSGFIPGSHIPNVRALADQALGFRTVTCCDFAGRVCLLPRHSAGAR